MSASRCSTPSTKTKSAASSTASPREKLKGKVNVTRFKGLGEMNPPAARTTMDPDTRRLVQLTVDDLSEGIEPGQHRLLVNSLPCLLVAAPACLILLALPQGLLFPVRIFRKRGFDGPLF
jgi:hypothetical protein